MLNKKVSLHSLVTKMLNKTHPYSLKKNLHILNKKETSHAFLKYIFSGCECLFANFILCLTIIREIFTLLRMSIKIEDSKFMSKEQFDARKGPNLIMKHKRAI